MGKEMTLEQAMGILGSEPERVIGPSICAKWNIPEINLPIRYCERTLREAVESNKNGKTDFCLAYFPGVSLFRQYEIRGADPKKRPYFNSNSVSLLEKNIKLSETGIPCWSETSSLAGFYLLDLKPRFPAINGWPAQEEKIVKLGYERAPVDVFLFAVQSIYLLTGRNVTHGWWHWSGILGFESRRVFAFLCDDGSVEVNSCCPDYQNMSMCVSVYMKN